MRHVLASLCAATAAAVLSPVLTIAQSPSPLAGVWTFNRSLSEMPREVGFDGGWLPAPGSSADQSGGASGSGRARRGSGAGGSDSGPAGRRFTPGESYDDARRVQLLTAEARNPPERLMIVDTPASVTIT